MSGEWSGAGGEWGEDLQRCAGWGSREGDRKWKAVRSRRRLEAEGGRKREARRGVKTGRRWGAPGEYEVFKISGLRLHNLLGSKRVKLVEGHAFKLNFVDADERVFDAFLGDDAGVDGV